MRRYRSMIIFEKVIDRETTFFEGLVPRKDEAELW